jgi:stearoyl-CoA desaturase (delta-9 desaturase)
VDAPRPTGPWWRVYFNAACIPFWFIHAAAVAGVIALGFSWSGLALALALYYARMFFVTGAYHRYFSHRSYKTSRAFQLALAFGAQTSMQKGALWWAANHRHHHRHSDGPEDLHSPRHGFWWSHIGWILCRDFERTDLDRVRDLARYPELRFFDRYHLIPPLALAATLFFAGGVEALVWGFCVSTVLLWHGTFTINSLSHVFGRRRYATGDDSTNNPLLALVTMGEGWHNNHHHFMGSAHQGFRWYEVDLTYYVLRLLALFGVVWDLKKAPAHIVEDRPRRQTAAGLADAPLAREPD